MDFDKLQKRWVQFMGEYLHCYEDIFGNMPCDNGCLCDKCRLPEVIAAWEKVIEKEGLK